MESCELELKFYIQQNYNLYGTSMHKRIAITFYLKLLKYIYIESFKIVFMEVYTSCYDWEVLNYIFLPRYLVVKHQR